ncbi:hypothetical protein JCM4814A_40980 [Streptomyces phaeofaciens JCM 4814]|uniref:Carrier domain-containing protein n=1 Tax=Streptomyces phaeofaciens TaxID=68254 RepID=A0A918HMG2_9ACTN|nr:acyl carrier protein [Streptomyces phaeofaciens]GGT80673.1 hypothetical protein GCM10010226_69030 [Streptomyces phaeofaciens]
MADDTREQIHRFITSRFPDIGITHEDDIFALGFINSLFAMELVMFIEKTFAFTIPNEELRFDNFRTVASIAALVDRNRPASVTASQAPR